MKFNFRKIAPVLASAVLLGSTIGFAVAATDLTAYPATFASKGKADVAIIYGEAANAVDVIAGDDIVSDLSSIYGTAGTSAASVSGGESARIETSAQKLYLGDYLNATKSALTDSELPTLLAKGKLEDTDGASYDITQKINVPTTASGYAKYTQDGSSGTDPVLYLDFSSSTANKYSYELSITPALDTTKMANKVIKIAGKEYTFSGNSAELNASDASTGLVLYGGSTDVTLSTKTNSTYVVNGVNVDVTIVGVNPNLGSTSEGAATITVNGESASVAKGKSYTLGGQRVYIRDIMVTNTQPAEGAVRIFLGSDKISFINGTNVKKGTTTLYGSTATFTYSGAGNTKITKMVVSVSPNDLDSRVKYLISGNALVDPVFGYKISLAGMTPDLMDSSKDKIEIMATGDNLVQLSFNNKRDQAYKVVLLKTSSTNLTATTNQTTLGGDNYNVIATVNTAIAQNDYFIVGSNEYTYVKELRTVDANNDKIKVRDKSGGTESEFTYSGVSGTITLDDGTAVPFLVDEVAKTINVTSGATPVLYTKGGAMINLTLGTNISITEETAYNDGSYKNAAGTTLGTTPMVIKPVWDSTRSSGYKMGLDTNIGTTIGDGTFVQVGTNYDWKAITKYGSFVEKTGQNDKVLSIYYPSAAAYLNAFVTSPTAVVSSTGATTAGKLGSISITDTEAETAKPSKNLIVVGGPAVNKVAAKLLGVAYPTYGAQLTGDNAITADQALIKLVASPYDSTKVAIALFGWDAKDTRAAAKYLVANAGAADLAKSSVVLTTTSGTAIVKK
jgi:hypothetical protein